MKFDYLADVKIIDLSQRLPGPYGSFILQSLGAKVTKLENTDQGGDFFNSDSAKMFNPNFLDWYKTLNDQKKINTLSFSNELSTLVKIIKKYDLIIAPKNSFLQNLFSEYPLESTQCLIYLSGGKNQWRSLHDLNALSFTKTFKDHLYHNDSLPYLPIAGMSYGQYLATLSLAMLRKASKTNKAQQETLYLKDTCNFLLDALHSEQTNSPHKFLHNGLYPCYQIYKTKDDHYVCLAAIEEKYWNLFIKIFNLPLSEQDRFDKSEKTHSLLKKLFAKQTGHEINTKINNQSICLTIVRA